MLNAQCSNRSAFTLVELSISLLIIGLIIGAITSGTTLVKQAKIRSVVSELRNIQTATNSFKLTYGTLPGDLANATSYWNTTNNGTLATSLANGNGNGSIDLAVEVSTGMQMLSLAGLIPNNVGYNANYPSKYGNMLRFVGSSFFASGNLFGKIGNYIDTLNYNSTTNASYTPSDAYAIDVKMDDGILYSGNVITTKNTSTTAACACTTLSGTGYTSTPAAVSLDSFCFTDTSQSCWMTFWIVD